MELDDKYVSQVIDCQSEQIDRLKKELEFWRGCSRSFDDARNLRKEIDRLRSRIYGAINSLEVAISQGADVCEIQNGLREAVWASGPSCD